MSESQIHVVVTGLDWMGGGIGSIEAALERILREAQLEVVFTVYSISSRNDLLLKWLENTLSRGVVVKMLLNRPDSQPPGVIHLLQQLRRRYQHFSVLQFVGDDEVALHAKTVVVDRRLALVGSSNLSQRGMLSNYELGLLVEGPAAAEIALAIDRLLNSSRVASF
jgi:phosphatidylserine/phosphatidylglycerophosphate/cardiolipin synthase-like enzyme